jgi:lipopolysaccharide export system permease protein
MLLRTPSELVLALPLATLLGCMTALYAMARTREITAIRCAGVNMQRIFGALLPLPLSLALVQFALSQTLVPGTEARLKTWWEETAPADEKRDPRWADTRSGPVSFERSSADGRRLEGLRVYARGDDGLITARSLAARANWTGKSWQLEQVDELRVAEGQVQRLRQERREWITNLRPDDVARLDVVQPHLSSMMLADVIVGERVGAQPLSYYQTVLFRSFTAPLGAFVMLLLAVPPASAVLRSGEGGAGLLAALALGLGFLLCDGLMSALGTSGRVPAAVAALAAPLLFAAIGIAQLKASDRL